MRVIRIYHRHGLHEDSTRIKFEDCETDKRSEKNKLKKEGILIIENIL